MIENMYAVMKRINELRGRFGLNQTRTGDIDAARSPAKSFREYHDGVMEAERLALPTLERATLLGQLMEGAKTAVGVCGTHGKTSTTSMIAQALVEAGVDPSVHIGGSLDFIGGSTRIGKGDVFLTEACEFNESFLQLRPTMAVITNIEEDHLD